MAMAFLWPGGKNKALAMSYDDGCRQDKQLVEVLNRYGIKGTFHLNSGVMENTSYRLSKEEALQIYEGHEIACHTLTHPYLERIAYSEVMREIWCDRANLEAFTGRQIRGMSYPMRNHPAETEEMCRAAGIIYARTAESTGKFNLPGDFIRWEPTCHQSEMLEYLPTFLKLDKWRKLSLFMVWGHGFDFERENSGVSWEMLEEFCSQVSQDNDVWFAGCTEICRYVNAVRHAEVSCDGNMVYNPSAETLYWETDDGVRCLLPGECKNIR